MTSRTFQRRLLQCIRAGKLWPAGARVVVAVSGGADSMAMLDALHALASRRDAGWVLHVAHLNHMLRGKAALRDAAFVQAQAALRGIPCELAIVDVGRVAREYHISVETAARRCRYGYFLRVAAAHDAECVAVAHHADDQAETVLHNVIRSTGWRGLAGMSAARELGRGSTVRLVRPLLGFRREVLRTYLQQRGVSFCTDASNRSPQHTRNRIRRRLLPLLERDFNPAVVDALLRLTAHARCAGELLAKQVAPLLADSQRQHDGRMTQVALRYDAWRAADEGVRAEALRQVLELASLPLGEVTHERLTAVAAGMVGGRGGRVFELPGGVRVSRRRGELIVRGPRDSDSIVSE